ncbi:cache domain-containing protein [Campylobacter coli]|uniref:cache domain-containing protein n=1 Tax=Campylobacter coli TaxID=195 RepID=UPI0008F52514|nr:cache domain-containing protein [Campylobacter coli]APA60374.1 hypothetical protein BLD43_08770 [Campylobacter coli]
MSCFDANNLWDFYYNNLQGSEKIAQITKNLINKEINVKVELLTKSMAIALGDLIKNVHSEEEKVKIIATAIENFRFEEDKSGYFFVYQKTTVKAHPVRKDLIGTDLYNAKDENGVFYVRELYQRALEKGGFVTFYFTKPQPDGKNIIAEKTAYSYLIPDTNDLWISTGVYKDTLEPYIDGNLEELLSFFSKNFFKTIIFFTLFILIIIPFIFIFYRNLITGVQGIKTNITSFFDFINHKTKIYINLFLSKFKLYFLLKISNTSAIYTFSSYKVLSKSNITALIFSFKKNI